MALPIDSPNTPEEVRQPRKEMVPRWLILVVAAIAFLFVAGWWTQRPLARIPLPDGSELLLIEAHYEPTFHYEPPVGLWQRLRQNLSRERDVSFQEADEDVSEPGGSPVLWLVFEGIDTGDEDPIHPYIGDVAAMESRTLLGTADAEEVWRGEGGRKRFMVGLANYPRRARRLELRIGVRDQAVEATIPNPRRVTDAPRWTPQPLPQSRKLATREIVLTDLRRSSMQRFQGNTMLTGSTSYPTFEVRQPGAPPGTFRFESTFSDATGNTSDTVPPANEPVWKIHTVVTPTALYPFPASEYRSFGRTTIPSPGQYRVLTLPADSKLVAALFFGAGRYRVTPGAEPKIEFIDSPPTGVDALLANIDSPPAGPTGQSSEGSVLFTTERPTVMILGQGSYSEEHPETQHLMRAVAGTTNMEFSSHTMGAKYLGISAEEFQMSSTNAPLAGTEVEIQLLFATEESVDFFVRPPQQ